MNPLALIEQIPRDKILHYAACAALATGVKIALDLALGLPRTHLAAAVFAIVAAAQVVMEYVVQPRQPGRTARDWRDALAGILGATTAALLIL